MVAWCAPARSLAAQRKSMSSHKLRPNVTIEKPSSPLSLPRWYRPRCITAPPRPLNIGTLCRHVNTRPGKSAVNNMQEPHKAYRIIYDIPGCEHISQHLTSLLLVLRLSVASCKPSFSLHQTINQRCPKWRAWNL
ncbi:hypothetical protein BDR06DRAFT_118196 [Suillus hirtellus]|nr:hypothetical protein BDR06DRAFT_118196 [Suillus hirtellus]